MNRDWCKLMAVFSNITHDLGTEKCRFTNLDYDFYQINVEKAFSYETLNALNEIEKVNHDMK